MKNKGLWSRNFTIITIGTIISAIGGVAINFALSFVVYDQSQSTLLTGIFAAISLLPALVLPLLLSPLIDRFKRKPLIVWLDVGSGIIYLAAGWYFQTNGFHYGFYLLVSLLLTSLGSIYEIAYTSLYPNLIPEGYAQQGYSVSSMIYPTIFMIMTPIAGFMYTTYGLEVLFYLEGILLIIAALFESQIQIKEELHQGIYSIKQYLADFQSSISYLKNEKGLQVIYTYMPLSNGIYQGSSTLIIAFFQSNPLLGATLYSFMSVAEFMGRTVGGLFQFKYKIPEERRFQFSYFVYVLYAFMDLILLFIGYPLMLLNRMICGFLGINSATLRESSVQTYIPNKQRGKINAYIQILNTSSGMLFRVLIGLLGEWIALPYALAICSLANIMICYMLLYRKRTVIKPIYNRVV